MRYDHLNMLPAHAFNKIAKRMTLEGGKSDAPATPDYTGAAQATAQGNADAARIAAKANRVSQYTPYGNLIYTQGNGTPTFNQTAYDNAMAQYNQAVQSYYAPQSNALGGIGTSWGVSGSTNGNNRGAPPVMPDRSNFYDSNGDPDTWTATQTLSPVEQAKLDKNNALSLGLLDTAQLGLSGVNDKLSKGFDFSALPAASVNAGQTAQDAIMARLDPKFQQSEDALRTRLINQGVRPGSQAWDNEFRNFSQGKNDAYSQAALQGIDVGQQARQQALQEQEFGRTEGLNMVNALRTGNQVQQPNFINTPQQATTAGADLLGATNAQYQGQLGAVNAQNANSANTANGLMSMVGTGATYFL